ncbi:hypothetical protein EDD18DRAFT_1364083 [Armillaria luteobubalina]|uniref:Uncharacterized protein n=1 Tax=Armillaria luteobubalina TaxID=153913 RepID=A0AA39UF23_9AGAR|nr:hypothetical protein EDD18DRAFT_1364083 [Armillaria luteobubalina]
MPHCFSSEPNYKPTPIHVHNVTLEQHQRILASPTVIGAHSTISKVFKSTKVIGERAAIDIARAAVTAPTRTFLGIYDSAEVPVREGGLAGVGLYTMVLPQRGAALNAAGQVGGKHRLERKVWSAIT